MNGLQDIIPRKYLSRAENALIRLNPGLALELGRRRLRAHGRGKELTREEILERLEDTRTYDVIEAALTELSDDSLEQIASTVVKALLYLQPLLKGRQDEIEDDDSQDEITGVLRALDDAATSSRRIADMLATTVVGEDGGRNSFDDTFENAHRRTFLMTKLILDSLITEEMSEEYSDTESRRPPDSAEVLHVIDKLVGALERAAEKSKKSHDSMSTVDMPSNKSLFQSSSRDRSERSVQHEEEVTMETLRKFLASLSKEQYCEGFYALPKKCLELSILDIWEFSAEKIQSLSQQDIIDDINTVTIR